jgi:NitT/TauT family transport system substrate-binding protein
VTPPRGLAGGLATVLGAAFALLAACAPAPTAPPPAAAPPAAPAARAPEPEPPGVVTVGIPRKTFGYLPLYVAQSKGYFQEAGIDVQPVETQCNLVIAAQQRGDLMLNGCGTSSLRAAAENNLPLKAILFSYNKATFVFVGHASISSLQDLRGKNVGISNFGAETHEIARRLLAKQGLEAERDYTFLVVGAGPQVFAALQSGSIQAGMLNTDEAAKIVPEGFKVLSTADEVGELLPIPFSGFTALESTLQKDAGLLRGWLRAYVRALVLVRDQPAEAARIAAAELQMDPAEAQSAVDLTVPAISRDKPGYATEEGMRVLMEYALGDLAQGKTPAQYFDFSLLDEVYRQGL